MARTVVSGRGCYIIFYQAIYHLESVIITISIHVTWHNSSNSYVLCVNECMHDNERLPNLQFAGAPSRTQREKIASLQWNKFARLLALAIGAFNDKTKTNRRSQSRRGVSVLSTCDLNKPLKTLAPTEPYGLLYYLYLLSPSARLLLRTNEPLSLAPKLNRRVSPRKN
jgi:hypothetical protein